MPVASVQLENRKTFRGILPDVDPLAFSDGYLISDQCKYGDGRLAMEINPIPKL